MPYGGPAVDDIRMEEMLLNVGPQHPSTHGVLRLLVRARGETIVEADPVIGYLHRGTEKLAENLQYTQIIPYTDRLDYLASMINNYALCHTVETAIDLEVPERAEHLRVLVMEMQRIASHLLFIGAYLLDLGAMSPFLYAFQERERIVQLFNRICGARLTYNYMRIGGVKYDAPEGWLDDVRDFVPWMKGKLEMYDRLITGNEIFLNRVRGIGVFDTKTALAYGISGVNLRSTGMRWDLRRNRPYSIYDRFEFDIPVGQHGDCFDRYYLHLLEMEQSLRIIEQVLAQMPDGPVLGKVPKIIRVPAGEYYCGVEGARGELGFYIVADGKDKPYRLKIRKPSFVNLQLLPELLRGQSLSNLIAILGAVDIVLGEVDA
ncbi:MAG: NADH-quinone oxidoreductase subunit D [Alicyclobacillaceae bacterium]|jgi:NADH-quinone oxidoreductase subunit D|uniref:NADH-quinone oxidoreductase subunit D n=1 Tax=Alicyclobacillus sp. SP_1 TaxID=2942475 RepID=UPI002156F8D5|nr:NADH-quinone oxidoreductase subunit D [Alicyclobacillus sp. SP_1]MCY0888714.1 NADH-quinone oxidoreductase subunit D [Alicyclobacillaceae bacterium]